MVITSGRTLSQLQIPSGRQKYLGWENSFHLQTSTMEVGFCCYALPARWLCFLSCGDRFDPLWQAICLFFRQTGQVQSRKKSFCWSHLSVKKIFQSLLDELNSVQKKKDLHSFVLATADGDDLNFAETKKLPIAQLFFLFSYVFFVKAVQPKWHFCFFFSFESIAHYCFRQTCLRGKDYFLTS